MNKEQFQNERKKAAQSAEIPGAVNPVFLFSNTDTALLLDIVAGKIDPVELAKRHLEGRGLDKDGRFVGFNSNIK